MIVDVITEIVIDRPKAVVAIFAGNPDNAPSWYENIETVERQTPPPLEVGSRVTFTAHFLKRRLTYTYEITKLVPDEHLVMRTAEGPFPMETQYSWKDLGENRTLMKLRNRGIPRGFSRLVASIMAQAMRRTNRKDLSYLKRFLEDRSARNSDIN
ncbi:MAG: SRPBCC family protein [Spirochaetaceae bacterium]|nr:MAG: SRPBCC family protein [Spirochaetaceae bacterium]